MRIQNIRAMIKNVHLLKKQNLECIKVQVFFCAN